MMDLDRFKGYNDRNGHPAGDELLVAVSRAIETCIRQGDRAYRYGGDEFAVILPDCPRRPAEEVARRIRAAVEAIPDESGGPHVTISVGIACHPDDATDKDDARRDGRPGPVPRQGRAVPQLAATSSSRRSTRPRWASSTAAARRRSSTRSSTARRASSACATATSTSASRATSHITVRAGIGETAGDIGFRMPVDQGVGGKVFTHRQARRRRGLRHLRGPPSALGGQGRLGGRRAARPSAAASSACSGLASGTNERVFRQPEVEALTQLRPARLDRARERPAARAGAVTARPGHRPAHARDADPAGRRRPRARPPATRARRRSRCVLIDVDRFEIVNESLGHAAGRPRAARRRARGSRRSSGRATRWRASAATPSRVLLPGSDTDAAMAFAERVQLELKPPFDLDGRTWFISASMGVSVGAPGASGGGDVLQEAEIALVGAKRDPTRAHRAVRPARAAAMPASASTSRPSCGRPSSATS